MHPIAVVSLLGLFQTIALMLGGSIVAVKKKFSREFVGFILSLASSMMLGIVFFELLKEATEKLFQLHPEGVTNTKWIIPMAFMAGVIIISLIDHVLPHWHHHQGKLSHQHNEYAESGWILLFGFLIHDFPEGLCIGAGYAVNPSFGLLVGISMFLTNVIEGITISIKFQEESMLNKKDLLTKISIPGLVVLIGSILGFYFVSYFSAVPYALTLALAAGALVFVTLDELVPEAYGTNCHTHILWGFITGFALVSFLSMV